MLNEFRSTSITWDKATRRIYSPITANGSDSNGRKLNIQVVNSGQVENLTGATLHLYWETKDKSQHGLDAFDASDISKGEFEIFYTTGMLSNVGELNATLVLVDSTGKVVSDWFKITVTRGINEDAIQSENSFTSLTQALIDISNLEQNYAPRLNDLTAQLQQTNTKIEQSKLSLEQQLEQGVTIMRDGTLVFPPEFPKLPFKVKKIGKRKYKHDATPYNQYDWSTATEVFISPMVSGSTLGTDVSAPISLARFKANYDSALYSGQTTFILTFITNVYHHSGTAALSNLGLNLLVRSLSPTGFTWIIPSEGNVGAENQPYTWVAYNSIYSTTKANAQNALDIVNLKNVDEYGIPKNQYTKAASLALCESTVGTFYQDGTTTLYCNPFSDDNINYNYLNSDNLTLSITGQCGTTIFENVGFTTSSFNFVPAGILANNLFYFFGCKFYRGLQDAFAIDGDYKVYLFDCVAAHGSKDGFNYHRDALLSLAVEINCIGYGAGKTKMVGGYTSTNSNNGSTAHSGMTMMRIGGKYWDCEGPIADADCLSASIGCEHYDILASCTGTMSGFHMYKETRPELFKYVVECLVSGKNFVNSVTGSGYETIYAVGNESKYPAMASVLTADSWEDAINA